MNLQTWEHQETIRANSIGEEEHYRLLKTSIGHYIQMNTPHCNDRTRQFMSHALADFVVSATIKFDRGQKEHGGDFIKDVDHQREMQQEFIDFFWYSSGSQHKQKCHTHHPTVTT